MSTMISTRRNVHPIELMSTFGQSKSFRHAWRSSDSEGWVNYKLDGKIRAKLRPRSGRPMLSSTRTTLLMLCMAAAACRSTLADEKSTTQRKDLLERVDDAAVV